MINQETETDDLMKKRNCHAGNNTLDNFV